MRTFLGLLLVLLSLAWMVGLGFLGSLDHGSTMVQHKVVHAPFLDPSRSHVLVFFGYVGCDTTCPTAMAAMAHTYRAYEAGQPAHDLGLVFITLQQDLDSAAVHAFAQSFHPDFEGVSLTRHDFYKTVHDFGVTFAPSLQNDYIIHHSVFLYLVRRTPAGWHLVRTYLSQPPELSDLLHDLKN